MAGSKNRSEAPRGRPPWAFASLGFELVAAIALGAFAGYKLDEWLDTRPGFFIGGFLLGIAVAFFSFFVRVWPTGRR